MYFFENKSFRIYEAKIPKNPVKLEFTTFTSLFKNSEFNAA